MKLKKSNSRATPKVVREAREAYANQTNYGNPTGCVAYAQSRFIRQKPAKFTMTVCRKMVMP